MLRLDKFIIVFLFITLFSCKEENKVTINDQLYKDYITHNFIEYSDVYKAAIDSVNSWIEDSLAVTKFIYFDKWQIDSVFIFNKDSSRLFTTINQRRESIKYDPSDNIFDFGGAKIDGKWYFFFLNVSEPIQRSYWQDSTYSALSFEELSIIAHLQRFRYATINENETLKPNEAFFNSTFYNIQSCKEKLDIKGCSDSLVLQLAKEKYKYKFDRQEIEDIKKAIAESVRPPEPTLSRWDKLFSEKKPFN